MVFWRRNNAKTDDIREGWDAEGRPKLKSAFTDELRQSVHNLEENHKNRSQQGMFGLSPMKSPFRGRRPTLSKEQQDELRNSVRNLYAKREQQPSEQRHNAADDEGKVLPSETSNGSRIEEPRRTLSKALADELRSSFHKRDATDQSRREEIKTRIMQRRQSRSQLYPHSIREETRESDTDSEDRPPRRALKSINPDASEESSRLRPALFDELRKSIHGRSTRNLNRRQEIKERIMKRRESQRILPRNSAHSTDSSEPSFAESEAIPLKSVPPRGKGGKTKKKMSWDQSQHSVDTFRDASFSDLEGSSGRLEVDLSTDIVQTSTILDDDDAAEPPADNDSLRLEWSKLARENKKLKSEAAVNEKKISILAGQVYDLKAEGTDLRKQLSNWQDKTSAISKRQSQDRLKFENSTDLIAKARVDLTKTLNENASLKGKIHELELDADDRQRRIQSLNFNIASQSERITAMSAELRDAQAELRYNVDEKRRVDEELAVIVASRDGHDIGDAIRRLEQDRAQWLQEKERALEAKRIALDEENDRVVEREKKKYREEADQLLEVSEKARDRELEHAKLQKAIDKQLNEMKEANEDLRDRLQQEHMENRVETKKKDHTIAMLEQEVSKLRRKLAASQLREQEQEARFVDIENNNEELRCAKKQITLLEKQIRKLKKERPIQKQGGDWKEIILPGYKNLRGVTFGAPSDELAGFLTILVEDQKAKQSEAQSKLRKEIKKYLKEYKGKGSGIMGKKGERKGKSKTVNKKSKVTKKSSAKLKSSKKKPKPSKQVTRKSSFTDIEDYDWNIKPKKVKKKESKRSRSFDRYSDDDSVAQSRMKRQKKGTKDIHYSDDERSGTRRSAKREKRVSKDKYYSDDDSSETQRSAKRQQRVTKKTKRKKKKKPNVYNKSSKYIETRHADRRRSSGGRRISRHANKSGEASERSEDFDRRHPEDVSLAVMKQTHKKAKRASQRRTRLPPVIPPATIILQ